MIAQRFKNRVEAGQLLAQHLRAYTHCSDTLILALPRGGVPVAYQVAQALNLPLDICLVRKLGIPGHKELAMGAIASGGVIIFNDDVVQAFGIAPEVIQRVAAAEQQELARRDHLYRGHRPFPDLRNQTIILIDDGIATGSTLRAAITAVRSQKPKSIVVAVPVAAATTCQELQAEVDKIVCLKFPEPLYSISLWYDDFSQTTDEEVQNLLTQSEHQDTINENKISL